MDKKKTIKELLGESLEELLKDKTFEKITVQEIAENCGVGRRSFYNNFRDKHDLGAWLYLSKLKNYPVNSSRPCLADYIRYSVGIVEQDAQLIHTIDQYKGQNNLRDSLVRPMAEICGEIIETYHGCKPDQKMKQDIEFFVGAQITFVGRVLNSPDAPAAGETIDLFVRCMPASIRQFV